MIRKGRSVDVRSSQTPPSEDWVVPSYLIGKTCIFCGFPFQDGDTHGEVQSDGVTVVCRTRRATQDPQGPDMIEGASYR